MVVADVLIWVFVILGLFLAFPAYWLVVGSLWPDFRVQVQRRFTETPGRTVIIGVLVGVGLFVLSALLLGAPVPAVKVIGLVFAGTAIGFGLAGTSGLAGRIGEGLDSPADVDRSWRRTIKGGAALEFSFLIPFFGWFLLLPLSLLAGAGASTLALFRPLPDGSSESEPRASSPDEAATPEPVNVREE